MPSPTPEKNDVREEGIRWRRKYKRKMKGRVRIAKEGILRQGRKRPFSGRLQVLVGLGKKRAGQ